MKKLPGIVLLCALAAIVPPSCGSHKDTAVEVGQSGQTGHVGQVGQVGQVRQVRPEGENSSISGRVASEIIAEARRWIGTPYVHGGKSRRGTDCSGMVMVIYEEKAGVRLPRNSARQQEFCAPVRRSELAPGDLVFFSSSVRGKRISHVGIYIGDDRFIHASSSRGVMVSNLNEKYYASHYHSAGRVPGVPLESRRTRPQSGTPSASRPEAAPPDTMRPSGILPLPIGEIRIPTTQEVRLRSEEALDSIINAMADSI